MSNPFDQTNLIEPVPTATFDEVEDLFNNMVFEPAKIKRPRIKPVEPPSHIVETLVNAHAEGTRPLWPTTAATYEKQRAVLTAAGKKLPDASVRVDPVRVLPSGQSKRVDDLADATHVRASVGLRRGRPKATNGEPVPAVRQAHRVEPTESE